MTDNQQYQVLARKYRPQNFDSLIGQEAMVRTLTNAFASGRIAHAFMMTGVRGIGKTTTARIIAKGLNCIGADGQNTKPTTSPCGVCPLCVSITDGRNIDVMELDAASNTQVEKMREILAGVPYRPSEARYKVYIFDEVHMLSNSAFNAILKTLEEPPEHVKFIFATTEIRKVPVTVLSRCQRFDLRRVEPEMMVEHLTDIAGRESAAVAPDALRLIARAAEGSVRDAQSLLDQAIAMGDGETTAEQVRAMMGLADQGRVLDLFEEIMGGKVNQALEILRGLYHDGADPATIMSELAEITHWVSLLRIADQIDDDAQSSEQVERGKALSSKLELPVLARTWQMLLKLGGELELAPNRLMGAEMAIVRLCHVADQPPPGELLAKLQTGGSVSARGGAFTSASPTSKAPTAELAKQVGGSDVAASPLARFGKFEDVVELIRTHRDVGLLMEVEKTVRLARYSPGRIEFALADGASENFPSSLSRKLEAWTGVRWGISVVSEYNAQTIFERQEAESKAAIVGAEKSDIVAKFKRSFPGAEIIDITKPALTYEESVAEDGNWDPIDFDDLG